MTKFPDFFAALAAPFDDTEVKHRPAQGGRQLTYITARTAMNRLDSVVGPEGWWDEYIPGENSVLCKLTLVLPDGRSVTKCDAGGYAGMADQGDDDKSGFSDSFKRACAKFGVARYLYRDGVPQFGDAAAHEHHAPPPTNGHANGHSNGNGHAPAREATVSGNSSNDRLPETGKALFAWMKKHEERLERPIVPKLDAWRKQNRPQWTFKTTEWDASQVSDALSFLAPLIASFDPENESQEPEPGTPRPRVQPTANGNGRAPAPAATDPLSIAKDDPLGPLKLAIKDACNTVVAASTGVPATPEGVMARIDWYATEAFGEGCVVGNLRECRDRAVLNGVLKAAEVEVGTLDAMEATP